MFFYFEKRSSPLHTYNAAVVPTYVVVNSEVVGLAAGNRHSISVSVSWSISVVVPPTFTYSRVRRRWRMVSCISAHRFNHFLFRSNKWLQPLGLSVTRLGGISPVGWYFLVFSVSNKSPKILLNEGFILTTFCKNTHIIFQLNFFG
jgi:hypothetical protein